MYIFITGESGTIPFAMQRLSKEYGMEVVNTQLKKNSLTSFKNHQSFKIRKHEVDFLDREMLFSKYFKSMWETIDVIIHSGAFVGTDYCNTNPNLAIRTNVEGTKNIVDICNKFNIKLVYLSTTAIFDPKDYSSVKPIIENTKIEPQTLYGITKYTGEQIVKKLCLKDYLVLRPVFGFGDYPDDLHSALTKVIYTIIYNDYYGELDLNVLLNRLTLKSYTRVENIARCILEFIIASENYNLWGREYNIGENYIKAKDWYSMFDIIFDKFPELKKFENKIKFFPKDDYLHYHNINDIKIKDLGLSFDRLKKYIPLEVGIDMTINSVIENIDKKPYWI